ncbi:MAG: dihydrolipoyl dehydrogenase [Candidatus Eisenbacteria bacterium]|nr:dihydrolipoyl dehydrogenase [Candidatus Eisenbacteria bacterium]
MQEFDLLVIGAGPAGYVGAIRAAQLGARVCLVEKAEVGGVCMNRGCIPTKSLVAFAELYEKTQSSAAFGVRVEGQVTADLAAAVRRKREVVATLVKGVRSLLVKRGVTLVSGEASFVNERTVEVAGARTTVGGAGADAHAVASADRFSAKKILVATGSEAAELPGLPFDGSRVMSSTEALELEAVPRSLLIVGAGAIGCEFAFVFSALGACVTVVEIMDRALPAEDRDISAVMERELRKRKIDLVTEDSVVSCAVNPASVRSTLRSGSELDTERVLVSVGRRFNTAGLLLDRAGVRCGPKGEILADEHMETSSAGVYAAGDVVGKKMYAHSASREAIVAIENALADGFAGNDASEAGRLREGTAAGRRTMDYSAVPACTFTRPEVGSVGLTEAQALELGLKVKVGSFNFRALGRAQVLGEIAGMVKVVADADTDVVLGLHVIGPHATELVHEGVLAVSQRLTARALSETIHAHPTLSEAVMEAAEGVRGLSIHSPA